MTEHVHEWGFLIWPGEAICLNGCGEFLEFGEIMRRLNATELLNAGSADYGAFWIKQSDLFWDSPNMQTAAIELRAYAQQMIAAALEGTDEKA